MTDFVPDNLPPAVRRKVLDWSDERSVGNPIMVTLAKGYAFYDNNYDNAACHVQGFDTKTEAIAGIRAAASCTCDRCTS